MAAVYAALLSISRSLHQSLNLKHEYMDPLHEEKIIFLHEKVDLILTFLEDYSEKHCGTLDHTRNEIRKAAYEAQDFMDSYLCSVSIANDDWSSSHADCDKLTLDQDLNMAFERISFILEEAMEMKNSGTTEDLPSRTYSSPHHVDDSSTLKITAKNMVVGFDDDLNRIKERLYGNSAKLQFIPIVGMGGIGKTTLAERAYEDSLLDQYFDICAWITMSAEYQRREVLSRLLQFFKTHTTEHNEQFDCSEAQLAKSVYQNLVGRRYLIVIDDIWSTKGWDDLKIIFPDNGNGSRILLTTRLLDVAVHVASSRTPLHHMDFLNEDQSWRLLEARIFGQESCPLRLVEMGKRIARNCGGLPLTIVVVAGLLSSSGLTKVELWENISNNISSLEPTIALQCSKILCLSYDRLPLRLKPCFLYIAAFPEDSEIKVSKLIKLWVAEGFLKPDDESKCLEVVAEGYLEDLVSRSLILVSKKGPNGRVNTVRVHDLLRDICMIKAEEERFLHHVLPKNALNAAVENPHRRLSIHCAQAFDKWQMIDSSIRSVVLFSKRYLISRLSLSCTHLSILDTPKVTWTNFSDVISTFVNLRYIAFALNYTSCPFGFPTSITKLPNLQTIIAQITEKPAAILLQVPCDIWEMPKLRHLIMDTPFGLSYPSSIEIIHESNLQTLETVTDFKFAEEAIKILVNIRKLKIEFDRYHYNWDDFNLHNIFRLQNLQELQISVPGYSPNPSRIWNYAFPFGLKKLKLRGVNLAWENMTILGSLPNLEVLQMMSIDVNKVSEWKPIEGQFLRLKYFLSSLDFLVKWEVEKEHFPSLESLILRYVWSINEIPCGIGDIDSLQLIELQYCGVSLVDSAKRIQKQHRENGNDALQVRIIYSDAYNVMF